MDYRNLVIKLIGKEPIVNTKKEYGYEWGTNAPSTKPTSWGEHKLVFKVALNELNDVIEKCIKLDEVLLTNPKDITPVNKYWIKKTKIKSAWEVELEKTWDKNPNARIKETFLYLANWDRGISLAVYHLEEETLEISDNVYLVAEADKKEYLNLPKPTLKVK